VLGVFLRSEWFILADQLTKPSLFLESHLAFVQVELSYLLLVGLGRGLVFKGGPINMICIRGEKGKLNAGLPFKG
jgi:hypothetical protein